MLTLRRAEPGDCRRIWEWANETEARAQSVHTEPIPWDVHERWFFMHIDSPRCLFYLATVDDTPVGQIRYDITDDTTAVVSVSLAKEWRGHGLGTALARQGSEQCFADSAVERIVGYIKPENAASIRAFAKAGFKDLGSGEMSGQPMRKVVMERNWR